MNEYYYLNEKIKNYIYYYLFPNLLVIGAVLVINNSLNNNSLELYNYLKSMLNIVDEDKNKVIFIANKILEELLIYNFY